MELGLLAPQLTSDSSACAALSSMYALLRALSALEQFGREPPHPVLWHPQFQAADPGDQRAAVMAAAIGQPRFSAPIAAVISAWSAA